DDGGVVAGRRDAGEPGVAAAAEGAFSLSNMAVEVLQPATVGEDDDEEPCSSAGPTQRGCPAPFADDRGRQQQCRYAVPLEHRQPYAVTRKCRLHVAHAVRRRSMVAARSQRRRAGGKSAETGENAHSGSTGTGI